MTSAKIAALLAVSALTISFQVATSAFAQCADYQAFAHHAATVALPEGVSNLLPEGDRMYVVTCSDQSPRLRILNVADPLRPIAVGSVLLPSEGTTAIAKLGSFVYVGSELGPTAIVDVSLESAPVVVGQFGSECHDLTIEGDHLYAAFDWISLRIFDLTDPLAPVQVSTLSNPVYLDGVDAQNGFVYASAGAVIYTIDASVPDHPVVRSSYAAPYDITDFEVSGDRAVLACGYSYTEGSVGRVQTLGLADPAHPVLLDTKSLAEKTSSIGLATDTIWIAAGYNLSMFPFDAAGLMGTPTTTFAGAFSTAIAVDGTAVYVGHGSEAFGCQYNGSFSIYEAPAAQPSFARGQLPLSGVPSAIVCSGQTAFLAIENQGLAIVDLSTPTNPVARGTLYDHRWTPCLEAYSHYVYLGKAYNGMNVVDVANLDAPVKIASPATPFIYDLKRVGDLLYAACEGELRIYSLANPAAPTLLGSKSIPAENAKLDVVGPLVYVQGSYHLNIIDAAVPSNPVLLGNTGATLCEDIVVVGDYAYSPAGTGAGLLVYSVEDPLHPYMSEQLPTGTSPGGVLAVGGKVLCGGSQRVNLLDIATPATPSLAGGALFGGDIRCLAEAGDYLIGGGQGPTANTFRLLVIPRPCATTAVDPAASVREPLALEAWPNPTFGATQLAFELPSAQSATVTILDIAGRVVRRIVEESRGAGARVVRWDGRDQGGRLVPSGVYLARLRAGSRSAETRVVRLSAQE